MKKVVNKIFGWIMFSGFVLLFGTAGSSDIGLIQDHKVLIFRGVLSIILMFVGYRGLKLNGSDAVI